MQFISSLTVTPAEVAKLLEAGMPQYKIKLRKNPLLRFEYVQVEKSAFVGAWVRVMKDNKITVTGTQPNDLVRGLLGGLLLIAFTWSGMKKIEKEVGEFLQEKLKQ